MLLRAESLYGDSQVRGSILNILVPGNEALLDLTDTFFEQTRREDHKALIACFYELKASNVDRFVGGTRMEVGKLTIYLGREADWGAQFVVDETSGCLDQNSSTEKYSLARNHFNMNKFSSPDEDDFQTVCDVMETFVRRAPELLVARTTRT